MMNLSDLVGRQLMPIRGAKPFFPTKTSDLRLRSVNPRPPRTDDEAIRQRLSVVVRYEFWEHSASFAASGRAVMRAALPGPVNGAPRGTKLVKLSRLSTGGRRYSYR